MSKAQTLASYEARLDRVTDYIYAHLEEDIRFEHLAEIACLSPYHWHRIYTAMRGETVTATIRRLRLLRAADRLANSDMTLKAIAGRAGYSAADAFGRAFKEAYGQSPAEYRASGSHAAFKAATRAQDVEGFPVEIVQLVPRRCAAIAHKGPYMQIDRAIGRLFAELAAQKALGADQPMMAVFFDDPDLVPVDALRSEACSPVAHDLPIVPPLRETALRGGSYARLRYKGPYADMKGAYRWLLGVWLPRSGHEPDDDPVFEAYLNNPQQVAPDRALDRHPPAAEEAMTSGLPIPPEVVRVLDGFSAPVRRRFLEIRELIFETAAKTEGVGPLTETLKWGEPAYLTAATGSGSTIRLGRGKASDTDCAVLFNCQTTLVESFRTLFPDAFVYEKNRAILVGVSGPLPAVPLAICVRMALTYHRRGKELGADDKQVIRGWPAQGRP